MAYVRKSIQRLNEILDEKELPENWDKFVEDSSKSENILIKRKNKQLYCTNCCKEYKYSFKTKNTLKCPFCKQELYVKHWNVKKLTLHKNLILVDMVENEIVLRLFELLSEYENGLLNRDVVEYGRYYLHNDVEIIGQNVSCVMGGFYISHCNCKYNKNKWRAFNNYWKRLNCYGKVYHYNLKELFNDTEYKYSQIWELAKRTEYINAKNILKYEINNSSFELLVKAKLYNLACHSNQFNNTGTFEKRFRVPRSYYPFMKKHNITYEELQRLALLKKEDIKMVRWLCKYSEEVLIGIKKYVSLDKFAIYSQKIKKFDEHTYKDYLKFCNALGFDMKDKKILFPRTKKELTKKHDELSKQYNLKKNELMNKAIKQRYNELKQNIFKDSKFIIKPAATYNEMIDEGKQQNNCVRTYASDYGNKECDIYFLRNAKTPKKALITVEVRNNKVVQSRVIYNKLPNDKQKEWLDMWQENILNKPRKEVKV